MVTMTGQVLQGVPSCPRCNRANPSLVVLGGVHTVNMSEYGAPAHVMLTGLFRCTTCGRTVLAESPLLRANQTGPQNPVHFVLPAPVDIAAEISGKPRQFLSDALASMNAPTASIMASCSAIDAMLKAKNVGRYDAAGKERSLKRRIEEAVASGILTQEMAAWAHKVRLDANDQRHSDDDAPVPTQERAREIFDLATGLSEVLIVLPAKVAALAEEPKEAVAG